MSHELPRNAVDTAVRVIVGLLVNGEFDAVAAMTHGRRLDAGQIAQAIDDYGRTLVLPSVDWWSLASVTTIFGTVPRFHVAAPLWTSEEGRSDLTIELIVRDTSGGTFDVELLGIHVLRSIPLASR